MFTRRELIKSTGRRRWVVVLCLVVLIVPLSGGMSRSWAQTEDPMKGDLRLSNGTTQYEGRVEVYYDEQWGTVCDDFFGLEDAEVVCRQLSYGSALQSRGRAHFGQPVMASQIWLDDVGCGGTEARLLDCQRVNGGDYSGEFRFSPIGDHNCNHSEDVGVVCQGTSTTVPTDPGILKSPGLLTVVEGEASTYSVVLMSAPTGEVTVTMSRYKRTVIERRTVIKVNPSTLTFTPDNWSAPQTVTVRALDDNNAVMGEGGIYHESSGGGYDDVAPSWVVVRVEDDDAFPGSVPVPSVTAAGPATLDVNWTAPTDAETPITGYDVQYFWRYEHDLWISSWQMWAHSGTATSTTITGLRANRTYEVQVRAKGSEGAGPWSPSGTGSPQAEVPEAPSKPAVQAGSATSLVVSWTAPADNGAALTDYNVQYQRSGTSSWEAWAHSGPHRRTTITGLQESWTYEVQVRARNSAGSGPWSPSGTGSPQAVAPEAPSKPAVRAGSATSLVVSWTAPADNGAALTDYDVQYRRFGASSWRAWGHDGPHRRTTITGLQDRWTYEVQVQARNAQGWGGWSGSGSGTTARNRPATGMPMVSGMLWVGEPLTVDLSGIMDADGLTNVLYAYQWRRVEGSIRSVIAGAAGESYTLTAAEVGKQIQVRVTFTDAGGTQETRVSEATAVVEAVAPVVNPDGNDDGNDGNDDGNDGNDDGNDGNDDGNDGNGDGNDGNGDGDGGTDGGGGNGGGSGGRSAGSGGGLSEEPTGYLENPGSNSFQSGIGVISGWVCEAEEVEIEIDGEPQPAAYGTERVDTLEVCGDTDNGFGLLFNWNLLGAGVHAVVAYVDGVELGRATVTVTTLGAEFVRGAEGACTVADFPTLGETVLLSWQQNSQNFVLTAGAVPAGENRAGVAGVGYLENPGANSFQSGLGVISGWVCEAEQVEIAIGILAPQEAGYGTERLDTQEECGDTNNGFGLLFNWNLLEDGEHAVVAYVDGAELGRATVKVTTLGEEFVRDVAGTCEVTDFPTGGETITLEWQEGLQNFVMTAVE